jgi:nuclear pore complex protein Nup205
MDNPEALKKFFDLMLSVLRIINSVVLKNQNDQTLKMALMFLTQNRHSVVAVFKRYAGISGLEAKGDIDLGDLIDNFTVLISATGFLEVSYPLFFRVEHWLTVTTV